MITSVRVVLIRASSALASAKRSSWRRWRHADAARAAGSLAAAAIAGLLAAVMVSMAAAWLLQSAMPAVRVSTNAQIDRFVIAGVG
jgi:hypothetical protein